MTLLRLFFEFAKTGAFAVGGGMATIPFLQDMAERTGWFTNADLTTMIAVSESTPGPIGINMATYVGYQTAGVPGAVAASLGLVFPAMILITVIACFLQKFRQSKTVEAVFYGLRPASTALIASAGLSVAASVLVLTGSDPNQLGHTFAIHWPALALTVVVFLCMRHKKLRNLHPVVFIGISALVGAVLQF